MASSSSSASSQAVFAVAIPTSSVEDLGEHLDSLFNCFERSLDLASDGSKSSSLSSRDLIPHNLTQITQKDLLVSNHFAPDLVEKREFQDLVTQHGAERVSSAIREIGAYVDEKLTDKEYIIHGQEMIKDVLEKGHVFTGIPVMVSDPNAPNGFSLQWRDSSEKSRLFPVRDVGLYCEEGQEELVRAATQKVSSFAGHDQMDEAFQYLKRNIPTGLKNDGCNMRCCWASFLLENVLGCESTKVKVDHRDGMLLKTKPPLVFEDVEWRMHTAPIVKLANGEEFVMDVALDRPMPLKEWLECLHSDQHELTLSYSARWDLECASTSEAPQTMDFGYLQKDLRGLYLFEMVDGNQSLNPDCSRRRSSTWMSWVDEIRGFSPIPQEQPIVSVIVDLVKQPNGTYSPVIERLPLNSMFPAQNGQYFKSSGICTKHQFFQRQNKLS